MGGAARKKTIVIIEDNTNIADLIRTTLNDETEYQALTVDDGSRALEVVQSVEASLILLDVMLPSMDGFQVYDMLKADPATSDIPIIFVTASMDDAEFKKRNIDHHIRKPFELVELLATVAKTLK
jgi:CheY-like chemotaxis protein